MQRHRVVLLPFVCLAMVLTSGCATLQQIAALRRVDFAVDRVSQVRLNGVSLDRIRSASDLSVSDAAQLALAVGGRNLPLDFQLHLSALNPADNPTTARLVRMDWTLLLEERETLSGVFDEEVVLPPGEATEVPIRISLNLVEFFEESGPDLLELALSLSGQGGAPKNVALRATPIIETALGPIRYPQAITIVSREVGED